MSTTFRLSPKGSFAAIEVSLHAISKATIAVDMEFLYGIYAQMLKVKAFPQLWQGLYLMRHIGGIQMLFEGENPRHCASHLSRLIARVCWPFSF